MRNMIITLDIIIVIAIIYIAETWNWAEIRNPRTFLIIGIATMMLSEMKFHSIMHWHHISIDKILTRATYLCFGFGFLFGISCALWSWISYKKVCDVHAIMYVTIATFGAVVIARSIEVMAVKMGRTYGRNTRLLSFVGDKNAIINIVNDIDNQATTGLRFKGYYTSQPDEQLDRIMPYLGNYDDLRNTIATGVRLCDEIYSGISSEDQDLNIQLMQYSSNNAIHFFYVPPFISAFGRYLQPAIVGEQVVFANFCEPLLDASNRMLKRTFDIFVSGFALLILLPFIPFIILGIEIQSPGNPFFAQLRTGVNGRDFKMWKFRSMHKNADSDTIQATKNDPRKFPFGNLMRKLSIDELPQLWNILIGDMSIVGPRPHMRKHTEQYSALIDNYMMRHYIRPGLTGWAQTNGFRGETSELWQMEGRIKKDIWYIQNWSFWLDIRIILRTIIQVFGKDKQAY